MRKWIIQKSIFADPRKNWLLEENGSAIDNDGGFINRHGPFQSSLNEGKHKRSKKPSLLRGIGQMFRIGKHRKDGIVPTETISDIGEQGLAPPSASIPPPTTKDSSKSHGTISRTGPPNYQPPPPVAVGIPIASNASSSGGIHQNDVFNYRYSHYTNYEELQQQIRYA